MLSRCLGREERRPDAVTEVRAELYRLRYRVLKSKTKSQFYNITSVCRGGGSLGTALVLSDWS